MAVYKSSYSGEQIDSILAKADSIEMNGDSQPTADAEKITIGDTTYNLDTGSKVVANPTDTATKSLSKIGIDDVVYTIPTPSVVPAWIHHLTVTVRFEGSGVSHTVSFEKYLTNHTQDAIKTPNRAIFNGVNHLVKPCHGLDVHNDDQDDLPMMIILDDSIDSSAYFYRYPFKNNRIDTPAIYGVASIVNFEDDVTRVE